MNLQVKKDAYDFHKYESEARFSSYYHQLRAVLALNPESLLEVGTGGGFFLSMARKMEIETYSVDIDIELQPTTVASVLELPFLNASIDVCVAFQVLEHLPFENFHQSLAELARVSRKGIVISLPEFGNLGMTLSLPYIRKLLCSFRILPFKPNHKFDGQHYWEINKANYPLERIIQSISDSGLSCVKNWLNPYNPYHRFFIIKTN